MKIRKTIALLTAFAMIAAIVPAMALNAFAAEEEADPFVIMADGKTAYKLSSDNLIADGSFETANWASQLNVGKVHGNDGKADISTMAENDTVWGRVRLAAEANDGQYAIRLLRDTSASGNKISDANKPASIKHYITNDSGADKIYYVSFYAMSSTSVGSLAFSVSSVDDASASGTGSDVVLNSGAWTLVEGVARVKAGENLLINAYNMAAGTLIDNFKVYEVYQDTQTRGFSKALEKWTFDSRHANGERITKDLNLPARTGDASVRWQSSDPSAISDTGVYHAPAENKNVTLTATITYGPFVVQRVYVFVAVGIGEDVRSRIAATVPYVVQGDITLINTLAAYSGSRITWQSSDPSIISSTGRYHNPGEQGTVTLTATFTYRDAVIVYTTDVVVGTRFSLIPNGTFDVVRPIEGSNELEIYGWTVGVPGSDSRSSGTAQMTTATFKYEQETLTDEDGNSYVNNYISSTGHSDLQNANSIRTYVALDPSKIYNLSYKLRYLGDGQSDESYFGAYLVDRTGAEIQMEPTSGFAAAYGNTYGGNYYKNGTEWQDPSHHRLTAEDGWQTYSTILRPDYARNYLLIAGKWLNRAENGHSDGRWAFDDFILEEYDIPFYGDVTINYYDRATGISLKDPRIVTNQPGGLVFDAEDSDKADIVVGSSTYRYDTSSIDSVEIVNASGSEEGNVINLYFRELVETNVTVNFKGINAAGNQFTLRDSATATGYIGFELDIPSELRRPIRYDGEIYAATPASFIVSENDEENSFDLVFTPVENLITNGDFSTGDTTGWTNRKDGALEGATVSFDSQLNTNAMTASGAGREDNKSIGTTWHVNVGTKYHLSFWVGGTQPEANNYQYNQITDSRQHNPSQTAWDCAGNVLVEFGKNMVPNQWTYMETEFVAQTDTIYFESSWAAGPMKFADFILYASDVPAPPDFTTSVTINYLDRETEESLKAPRVQQNVEGYSDGSTIFSALESDKADIKIGDDRYIFDPRSVTSVTVREDASQNVINLYFNKAEEAKPVSAEDIVLDLTSDANISLPSSVSVLFSDGSSKNSNVTWDPIPVVNEGETVVIDGVTDLGPTLSATIRRFYAGETKLPEDYEEYDWIQSGNKNYAVQKGAQNIITNGDFATGSASGFTNRSDGAITGASFAMDSELGVNAMTVSAGGRSDTTSVGTTWTVETGKKYLLSFYVGGEKPSNVQGAMNWEFNRISDGKAHTASQTAWDIEESSNILVPYGELMTANQWNHMEKIFTAATDMVYFQCSWVNNIKFADFKLYEIVDENKYFEGGSTMTSKVAINVNGNKVEDIYVSKGESIPQSIMDRYQGYIADISGVDTNNPNGGTAYFTDPDAMSTLSIGSGRVLLIAIGETISGTLIIAQYDADGNMVAVSTSPITAEVTEEAVEGQPLPSGSATVNYNTNPDAVQVRAILVDSIETLRPLLRSAARSI